MGGYLPILALLRSFASLKDDSMGVVGTFYVYKVISVWNVRLRLDFSATFEMTKSGGKRFK
jgi:hypothetical protein